MKALEKIKVIVTRPDPIRPYKPGEGPLTLTVDGKDRRVYYGEIVETYSTRYVNVLLDKKMLARVTSRAYREEPVPELVPEPVKKKRGRPRKVKD